jgi:GntR family transcriptional regulator
VIEFRLDTRSGVPTYLQIVQQVKQAARLGLLQPGDQLPTVKEVVGQLTINPNTVLKAYRELDHQGFVEGRRGQGTFLSRDLSAAAPADHMALQSGLTRWVKRARDAGFDQDGIAAMVSVALRDTFDEEAVA